MRPKRHHLALICILICNTLQAQQLKLVSSGNTNGIAKGFEKMRSFPMPEGHFIFLDGHVAYAYDFKEDKDMVIDEKEAKRVNKGKPDPENPSPVLPQFPKTEVIRNKIVKYDPYKGILRITNSLLRIEKSVNFNSMLKWHLSETNDRWSTQPNGTGGSVIYGRGKYKNLSFKIFEGVGYADNPLTFHVWDETVSGQVPKYIQMGSFRDQIIVSPNFQYFVMIRWKDDFAEVAYYASNPRKYSYFYLKGNYQRAVDPFKGSFLDNLGNLYLANGRPSKKWAVYNPTFNPISYHSELAQSDPSINAIKDLNRRYDLKEEQALSPINFEKSELHVLDGKLSLEAKNLGGSAHEIILTSDADQTEILREAVQLSGTDIHFLLNHYSREITAVNTEGNTYRTWSYEGHFENYLEDQSTLTYPSPFLPGVIYPQVSNDDLRIYKGRYEKERKRWPGDEAFKKRYGEERAYRQRNQKERFIKLAVKDGIVTGMTLDGIREGYWDFKGTDGSEEVWKYKGGYRIDEAYKEIAKTYRKAVKEKQNQIYASNLSPVLEEYQRKVDRNAKLTSALRQVAVVGAGSTFAKEFGVSNMNSLEFGMALNQDIQNGTTSNLQAFLDSYQNMSTNSPNFLQNMEETFELPSNNSTAKNGTTSSPNVSSTSPGGGSLIGTWVTTSGNISITFNSGGKGTIRFKDANNSGTCLDGTVNDFDWTSTDSTIELIYTSAAVCGEPRDIPDSDGPKNYSFEGSTLVYIGARWNK